MQQMPVLALYNYLNEKVGPGWADLEMETLSLHLQVVFDELTWQKITLLKALLHDAKSFEAKLEAFDEGDKGVKGLDEARIDSEPIFAIHAVDLINEIEIEPSTIAMPTLLELAYAIKVLLTLPIKFNPATSELWKVLCETSLKEEGFDRPFGPFLFVDEAKFPEKVRTEQEISAALTAIRTYIQMMEAGHHDLRVPN